MAGHKITNQKIEAVSYYLNECLHILFQPRNMKERQKNHMQHHLIKSQVLFHHWQYYVLFASL